MPSSITRTTGSQEDPFLYVFAIIFPPLAVALRRTTSGADLATSILLTLLGWIPGVIHAWLLLANGSASSGDPNRVLVKPAARRDSYSSARSGHHHHNRASTQNRRSDVVYVKPQSRRHQQPDMVYVPVNTRTRSRSRSGRGADIRKDVRVRKQI